MCGDALLDRFCDCDVSAARGRGVEAHSTLGLDPDPFEEAEVAAARRSAEEQADEDGEAGADENDGRGSEDKRPEDTAA